MKGVEIDEVVEIQTFRPWRSVFSRVTRRGGEGQPFPASEGGAGRLRQRLATATRIQELVRNWRPWRGRGWQRRLRGGHWRHWRRRHWRRRGLRCLTEAHRVGESAVCGVCAIVGFTRIGACAVLGTVDADATGARTGTFGAIVGGWRRAGRVRWRGRRTGGVRGWER